MTTAQIAIPAVFLAFSALFVLSRVVRHRNAARAHGRHENGHTMHDGLPPAARRLPSARGRAAALADLAEPCPACGVDHIGDCVAGTLPVHLRPGVVLPSTPKLAAALEPLPAPDVPGPDSSADRAPGYPTKLGGGQEFDSPSGPGTIYMLPDPGLIAGDPVVRATDLLEPDLTITTTDAADEAYADVKARFGLDEAPPAGRPRPGGQTTGEIFEHLCEGTGCWCHSFRRLPAAVVKELKHETVDEAVASIVLHAKEAAEFRAELEARLAEDDAAHASGQVASDA
jgi:hypothetical protein